MNRIKKSLIMVSTITAILASGSALAASMGNGGQGNNGETKANMSGRSQLTSHPAVSSGHRQNSTTGKSNPAITHDGTTIPRPISPRNGATN